MAAIIQTESLFAQSDKTVCGRHSMGGYSDKRMGVAVFLVFFLFLRIETAWAVPACPVGAKVAYPRQDYDDFNQVGFSADGAVGLVKKGFQCFNLKEILIL
jgi:hypothetical protein